MSIRQKTIPEMKREEEFKEQEKRYIYGTLEVK